MWVKYVGGRRAADSNCKVSAGELVFFFLQSNSKNYTSNSKRHSCLCIMVHWAEYWCGNCPSCLSLEFLLTDSWMWVQNVGSRTFYWRVCLTCIQIFNHDVKSCAAGHFKILNFVFSLACRKSWGNKWHHIIKKCTEGVYLIAFMITVTKNLHILMWYDFTPGEHFLATFSSPTNRETSAQHICLFID